MAVVVRMPSVLAGADEAAIARWLVAPGDAVAVGTPLAEIETEKALVEYEAEAAGTVGRLVLAEGASGEIGDPIAVLVAPGETGADIDAALGVAAPAPAAAAAITGAAARNGHAPAGARVFASPLVRKLAAERGVALSGLAGTGPNGRITRRDLERSLAAGPAQAAAAGTAPAPVTAPGAPGGAGDAEQPDVRYGKVKAAQGSGTLVPHSPMRRAIARRLAEAKATVPHFYLTAEPVVDELLALRKRVNEAAFPGGAAPAKVSVNDFVLAAAAAAYGDVPEANVTWSDEGMVSYSSVDISVAVATDGGLVTPVLRGVEGLRLSAVARQAADLARRARERRLLQRELEGGTITVSNLGMYGTAEFAAIINPPQSMILAVGAARQQPVAVGGALAVATVMRCTLSVDHRAVDGALAARWLAAFTARMENPLGILA
jgi:pyruvate dehydrogenase E2 component (dihydrolipoamide acetyltransferase)